MKAEERQTEKEVFFKLKEVDLKVKKESWRLQIGVEHL